MVYMTRSGRNRKVCSVPSTARMPAKACPNAAAHYLQALNLLNSSFVMQQAGLFAKRLQNDAGEDLHRHPCLYLCFNRPPNDLELMDAAFIKGKSLSAFARAMLNANGFCLCMNPLLNRRQFLSNTGQGLGGIALTSLLAQEGALANENPIRPKIDPTKPFAPGADISGKAKKVLVIFCSGAYVSWIRLIINQNS